VQQLTTSESVLAFFQLASPVECENLIFGTQKETRTASWHSGEQTPTGSELTRGIALQTQVLALNWRAALL
jgi:hypothetical protein